MNATKLSATLLSLAVILPMLAQAQVTATPVAEKTARMHKTLDVACVISAIDTRDTAIESAVDAYASAWKAALETRKNSLKAAWSDTDAKMRRQDIQKAWSASSAAVKSANQDFEKARKNAWKQFRKDNNSCGSGVAKIDRTGSGVDNMR